MSGHEICTVLRTCGSTFTPQRYVVRYTRIHFPMMDLVFVVYRIIGVSRKGTPVLFV